jgi:hypothetical protein
MLTAAPAAASRLAPRAPRGAQPRCAPPRALCCGARIISAAAHTASTAAAAPLLTPARRVWRVRCSASHGPRPLPKQLALSLDLAGRRIPPTVGHTHLTPIEQGEAEIFHVRCLVRSPRAARRHAHSARAHCKRRRALTPQGLSACAMRFPRRPYRSPRTASRAT